MTNHVIDLRNDDLFNLCTFTYVTLNCLILLLLSTSSDPKGKFSCYGFIMTNKVVLINFFCLLLLSRACLQKVMTTEKVVADCTE